MKWLRGHIILFILFCALCSIKSQTHYSSDTSPDSIAKQLHIDEITITAQRRTEPIVPAQTLEADRLLALSTYSVADAVRYFSGVQIKDYGGVGGLKTIDLRSMGTHHIGVFYDGIEIGNAQNGVVDLGKFSMDNIEQVTLYNGQKSDIFQSAKDFGSAGTLYLRTRRPIFSQDKSFNLQITMKAGTFGLANPSILYEQRLTDNIHLSANAEYQYAHGRYHFHYKRVMPDGSVAWDTTAVRHNGDVHAARAEVGLFGYLPEGKWHIKGYFYQSEKGIPGAIVNNVWTNAQRQWDTNAFVQGSYSQTVIDGYDLQLNAKYSNDYLRYLNPDTTLLYIDNTFSQQETYLSLANRFSLAGQTALFNATRQTNVNWDLSVAIDWQFNTLNSDMKMFAYPSRHSVYIALATQADWRWFKLQTSVLGTYIKDQTRTQSDVQSRLVWTPAVFFSYQPYLPEQLFIRAYYKQNMRMPTFNDLYYTDVGNISLLPERCSQFNAGVEYTKTFKNSIVNQLHLKADGYYNQIHNKIVAVPKGNGQYRWMMMNIGYVEIRGLDANASIILTPVNDLSLSLALNYTYQQAQDFTNKDEITYGGQIAYIPWHSGSVIANIKYRDFALNYSFIYVGERYHNSANIPANYEQPWYTHDLSLSYNLDIKSIINKQNNKYIPQLNFAVEINNLFNQQYEVILNYPMPGINGKAIVKIII